MRDVVDAGVGCREWMQEVDAGGLCRGRRQMTDLSYVLNMSLWLGQLGQPSPTL